MTFYYLELEDSCQLPEHLLGIFYATRICCALLNVLLNLIPTMPLQHKYYFIEKKINADGLNR
jgi:hypothetical protein